MTSENLMKLQGLFRELFQLDMADLDFGLYRLFNIKRREIEDFLTRRLPEEVDEKFHILTERDKADHREWLEKLEEQIRENLPPDTLLPNGDVKSTYRDAPLVKRYLDQKVRLERIQASEEQKADVFNHLFNFLAVTMMKATLSQSGFTAHEETTLFLITVKKCFSTGPIKTSTT